MINTEPFKIAIASGKGGTGKTLLATNLASNFSLTKKTLLVDLDVEEPNDFIFIKSSNECIIERFKMIPEWDENKCTLCGLCSKTCKYHAVIQLGTIIAVFEKLCHSCFACSELCPKGALPMRKHKLGELKSVMVNRNLSFLESRLEIGEEQAVPLINQTHGFVSNTYRNTEVQIFDCPPGTSCPVTAATKNVDFVVLVTEPTPFGLNDLKLAVETMHLLKKPMGVVINRDGIGNGDIRDYCDHEQIPVLASIPFSREIAEYYSNGELIYDKVENMKTALSQIVKHFEKSI